MFEDVTKSHIVTMVGLALATAALRALLPNMRPAVRSAITIGLDLLSESHAEAEAELMHSLVAATVSGIRDVLSEPGSEPARREAVRARVDDFKRKARIRARRWADGHEGRERSYRRQVRRLETSLAQQKQQSGRQEQPLLDYAFTALASEG